MPAPCVGAALCGAALRGPARMGESRSCSLARTCRVNLTAGHRPTGSGAGLHCGAPLARWSGASPPPPAGSCAGPPAAPPRPARQRTHTSLGATGAARKDMGGASTRCSQWVPATPAHGACRLPLPNCHLQAISSTDRTTVQCGVANTCRTATPLGLDHLAAGPLPLRGCSRTSRHGGGAAHPANVVGLRHEGPHDARVRVLLQLPQLRAVVSAPPARWALGTPTAGPPRGAAIAVLRGRGSIIIGVCRTREGKREAHITAVPKMQMNREEEQSSPLPTVVLLG